MIPDENLRLRMCTGKHKHVTFEAAQKQLNKGKKKGKGVKGLRLNAYKCKFCDGFHVGHETLKGK